MVVDVTAIGEGIENEMDPSGTAWLHGVEVAQSSAEWAKECVSAGWSRWGEMSTVMCDKKRIKIERRGGKKSDVWFTDSENEEKKRRQSWW